MDMVAGAFCTRFRFVATETPNTLDILNSVKQSRSMEGFEGSVDSDAIERPLLDLALDLLMGQGAFCSIQYLENRLAGLSFTEAVLLGSVHAITESR